MKCEQLEFDFDPKPEPQTITLGDYIFTSINGMTWTNTPWPIQGTITINFDHDFS